MFFMIHPAPKLFAAVKEKCRDAGNTKGKGNKNHTKTHRNAVQFHEVTGHQTLFPSVGPCSFHNHNDG
jgi:hypothetical protein